MIDTLYDGFTSINRTTRLNVYRISVYRCLNTDQIAKSIGAQCLLDKSICGRSIHH